MSVYFHNILVRGVPNIFFESMLNHQIPKYNTNIFIIGYKSKAGKERVNNM